MGVLDFRRATQILDVVFHDLGERLPFKLPSFLLGLTVARSRDPSIREPLFQHVVRCSAEAGAGTCRC
jgi:hypothetical protein